MGRVEKHAFGFRSVQPETIVCHLQVGQVKTETEGMIQGRNIGADDIDSGVVCKANSGIRRQDIWKIIDKG